MCYFLYLLVLLLSCETRLSVMCYFLYLLVLLLSCETRLSVGLPNYCGLGIAMFPTYLW